MGKTKYIDADQLLAGIYSDNPKDVMLYIATFPAADVVEVVRCKDCKHYQFADNRAFGMPVKMCEWFGFEDVDDNDFCSRAERRTDG